MRIGVGQAWVEERRNRTVALRDSVGSEKHGGPCACAVGGTVSCGWLR